MKLHWQDTEVHRGKYRQVKREVDLVFIEKEWAHVEVHRTEAARTFEPLNPKSWERPHYTVAILRVKGRKGIVSGVSRFSASEGEISDYSKGRKLALGRALLQAFPGKHSSARRKAWYSYRLQTEMDAVKKEEQREQQQVASALHQSRMEAMESLLTDMKKVAGLEEVKPDGDPNAG